jgi:hypothetical protein
MRELVAHYKN